MGSLNQLAKSMKSMADQLGKNVDKTIRLTALAIDRELVLSTPVDTGRARSNWFVSTIDSPRLVRSPFLEGSKLGKGEATNARGALDHAKQVIKTHQSGQSIFISNNVEYIVELNTGTSAQAPAGFIESAIKRGEQVIAKAKLI